MLRRYIITGRINAPRTASLLLASSVLVAARHVASGTPSGSSSGSSGSTNTNNKAADAAKKEDEAELERERKLREAFGQKIGGAGTGATSPFGGAGPIPNIPMPTNWGEFKVAMKQVKEQARAEAERRTGRTSSTAGASSGAADASGSTEGTGSSSTSAGSGFGQQTPTGPQPGPMFFFLQNMYTFLVYGTALYALIILWQMRDDGSLLNLMQGLPHWAGNPTDAATFLLMRVLYSYKEQNALQTDFETFRKMAPDTTFRQFTEARNSAWFGGNRYRHHEVVAVVAGALVNGDFGTVTRTMGKAARASRDRREQCDAIADAVRQLGFQPLYATQQPMTAGGSVAAPVSMQQALAQQYQQSLAAYQQMQWYQQQQQQFLAQQQQKQQQQPNGTSPTGNAELDQVVTTLTSAVQDGEQKPVA